MKLKALGLTAVAVATAALVAACGGGGGGGDVAATQSDVQLSGVAATGLALASAPVDVKCASGTGTATTNESGAYTVTVANGALPCIVKVTGTAADGTTVTLHSLAEGTGTTATANVTPLTELILARATGAVPSALYENFTSGTVTVPALTQATTDVLAAMGGAAGIDLSGVDPFKGSLVAATTTNPDAGNAYDKLLDQLGAVVTPAMLPQVVSQVAQTGTGSGAAVTLDQVVANVQAGALADCPQALSGKYGVLDYDGAYDQIDLNFGTLKVNGELTIVPSTTQKCEFSVNDTGNNVLSTVVFGPSGVGVVRDSRILAYIFPVQSTSLASVVDRKWEFLESGIDGGVADHWVGEMAVDAGGNVAVCDYSNLESGTCVPATETVSFSQSGTTLLLNYDGTTSPIYGYRAPDGSLTLFGYNHTSDGLRSSFVLTRPQSLQAQSVGEVARYWSAVQRFDPARESLPEPQDALFTTFAPGSLTVTAATADSVTRTFADGSTDTWLLNQPIPGLRKRATPLTYQRVLPGLGITVGISGGSAHTYSVSVGRPAE